MALFLCFLGRAAGTFAALEIGVDGGSFNQKHGTDPGGFKPAALDRSVQVLARYFQPFRSLRDRQKIAGDFNHGRESSKMFVGYQRIVIRKTKTESLL